MILGLRASLSPRLALFGRRGPCSRACSTGVSTDMEIGTNGQRDIYQRRYRPLRVQKTGIDLLHDPLFNKGTGYGYGERGRMRLRGLVPPRVLSMDQQMAKLKGQLDAMGDDMQKALFLVDLHDRNETLYHRMLLDHIEEMAPLVYTPTVGRLCSEFGDRYRRPRGMYFTPDDDNNMDQMLHNWPQDDVRVVVVTDGSRILGLGDLGANGMGIPIGKLALYCAAGGVAPHRVLPVTLDFGTNNPALLENPYYLGVQSPRLEGDAYFELLDEFMSAIRYRFPASLVQFEDFSSDKAQFILDRYRNRHLCFNDDIQGTGATTLAGVLSALRVKGLAPEDLHSQRFVILGAGSAGTGVAEQLKQGMMAQGLSEAEARARFYLVDEHGLLSASRGDALQPAQATFARTETDLEGMGLVETIKHAKPHVLLGLSSVGGLFTEEVVREMAAINERPIVFPLSNPTANAECTASDAFAWSDGRVIFASGSPFDPVIHGGKTYEISQCNNMFIFPGLGFGATTAGAKTISDAALFASSVALANSLADEEMARGQVFPSVSRIREVSLNVATAVVRQVEAEGHCRGIGEHHWAILENYLARKMYNPTYVPLV